jgi:hypothetical protein
MKKVFLLIGLAVVIGCFLASCDKDSVKEILPNANVELKDGEALMDEINMSGVAGSKYKEMTLITGTKVTPFRELLVYADGKTDGTYPVNIDATSLLNFNFKDIKSNTVVYYVSIEEMYLLVDGEITLTNTESKMMSGTFTGKVIRANNLTSSEIIDELLNSTNISLTGDFRAYSIKW